MGVTAILGALMSPFFMASDPSPWFCMKVGETLRCSRNYYPQCACDQKAPYKAPKTVWSMPYVS